MKLNTLSIVILAAFCLCAGCDQKPSSNNTDKTESQESSDNTDPLNWQNLAELLVSRMQLTPGEQVLLVGRPGRFDSLIGPLKERIESQQAKCIGILNVDGEETNIWQSDWYDLLASASDETIKDTLKSVDIGIMLPGASPEHKVYGLIQENLSDGFGRTIHFHWSGAYAVDGKEMDIDGKVDAFYSNALLNTDYNQLANSHLAIEQALRKSVVRVTTPAGTDISFQVGDRPITKQDGDASGKRSEQARNLIDREIELPAGALRVAPLEETVEGTIAFPDAIWAGQPVEGLKLRFEQGKVVHAEAQSGLEAYQEEMQEAGEAGQLFREWALGLNPHLSIPQDSPWIPYYGYGAGVVRLSLGNNLELGGNVGGNYVRWNFFTDADVFLDDVQWVKAGILLK